VIALSVEANYYTGSMAFDFNGDSLLPEQDNLFDELLDDLAFETDGGAFDNNFLGKDKLCERGVVGLTYVRMRGNVSQSDFDFGTGLLGKFGREFA
jgi:hypothetical protein